MGSEICITDIISFYETYPSNRYCPGGGGGQLGKKVYGDVPAQRPPILNPENF